MGKLKKTNIARRDYSLIKYNIRYWFFRVSKRNFEGLKRIWNRHIESSDRGLILRRIISFWSDNAFEEFV